MQDILSDVARLVEHGCYPGIWMPREQDLALPWTADRDFVLTAVQDDAAAVDLLAELFRADFASYEEGEQAMLREPTQWHLQSEGERHGVFFRTWLFKPARGHVAVIVGRRDEAVHTLARDLYPGGLDADFSSL